MPAATGRRLLLAGLCLAVAAALAMAATQSGRELLSAAVAWLGGAGPWGRVVAVAAVLVGIPLGVPTLWLAALIGYLFGVAAGVPVALVAVSTGAVLAFSLARWLVLDRVRALVARRPRWRAIADAVGEGGVKLVVLLRLAGPHNVLNVALAASPLTLKQFAAGTAIGSAPSVGLAALGGALGRDAASLWQAREQLGAAWLVMVAAGAVALVVAVALMLRATRRALARLSPYNVDVPAAPLIRHTDDMEWEPSPSATVLRKRLELIGPAEAGRVTSVVRYLPDSSFHPHPHPDGEEILVLEGIFTDKTGDHPAGSYLLNPEGFEHAPSSRAGCVLFVKLRQYAGTDRDTVRIDSARADWSPHSSITGVEVIELYRSERYPETMRLVRIAPGAEVPVQEFPRGEEIFVLEGAFGDEHGAYRTGSWVRYPPGSRHTPRSERGCTLYVKKDHLGG
ncbi:MAG TPA: cupin domain-containing protein [Kofleriaceae bacterium]|nr:cupin domain-containing protein [Kofleriaceae bacterium]